jgi:hypothetical protein
MAVEIYVVLQPFEFENRMLVRGEEIACRSREGEDLVKAGKVVRNLRQLDPDTKKDKALIDAANERAHSKHADESERESVRDEQKDENAAKRDEKRASIVARVKDLVPDDEAYVLEASTLPDDKLEELVVKLETAKAEEDDQKKKLEVEDKNEVTNVPVRHVQSPRK